jgi:hypothetical protein
MPLHKIARPVGAEARHVDLDDGDAFFPDYRHRSGELDDGDAEALGEAFIATATSAEDAAEPGGDEALDGELVGLTLEAASFDELDVDPDDVLPRREG